LITIIKDAQVNLINKYNLKYKKTIFRWCSTWNTKKQTIIWCTTSGTPCMFKTIFLDRTKFEGGHKIWGQRPQMPPVATGLDCPAT